MAIVACMDARLNPYGIFGLIEGDAHVIRNAGGGITDDTIRSLSISQRLLGTEEVVILQHTGCGMTTFADDSFRSEIEAETGTRPRWHSGAFSELDEHLRTSIRAVADSPFLAHHTVRGFVFDVTTGALREVSARSSDQLTPNEVQANVPGPKGGSTVDATQHGLSRLVENGPMIDREKLETLISKEHARYSELHPGSRQAAARTGHLLQGVPMTWMADWAGGFPLHLARARGATVTDVDGITYADFCLGDTGAMAGHSPAPTLAAIRRRAFDDGGITAMLPSSDATGASDELARRFGLPLWSFTLTATDANRWAIRVARHVTGRPKILVFNWCYHGTVDETFATLRGDKVVARTGNVGPPVDPGLTTRVVEFNDLPALEQALAGRDVAAVLAEPALTNIGIVLPDPGFHDALRALTRDTGTLLLLDETHTFSAGPRGAIGAWALEPDIVTLGKAIAGGIPAGAYGLSAGVAERLLADPDADLVDVGGVGGTLAGNALSMAATVATLSEVLTDTAFAHMTALAERYESGVNELLRESALPWSITRLGARAELRYCSPAPRSGAESAAAGDSALDEYLHLYLANREVLLTPFHNMALMCPDTTEEQVGRLLEALGAAVAELAA